MTQPYELTIVEAANRIADGTLSTVALMESLLARSDELDASLRVWVTLDAEAALDAARQSERELEERGPRGPLHGIPVGVKDIYHTEGVLTTACSPIYADFVPERDAASVSLLKRAGAIIMGKAMTTQFASGDPSPTRNPWNAAHTPGGSSSGSAAGVAARMFPVAMGSQTGGSILRPASYNGVVGLKPTYGRISKRGVIPLAWTLDTLGPIARCVEDTAIVLDALAGYDPEDLASSARRVGNYRHAVGSRQSPPRIGVVGQFFDENTDDEVRGHTRDVVERLAVAGADVEEVTTPGSFDTLLAAHRVIMAVEASGVHQADFAKRPDDFAPRIRSSIEVGALIPAVAYVRAQRARQAFRREMLDAMRGFDALLTPSTPSPAPRDLTTTGNPMFQAPWTTCGFPAITLPSGLSASGLPLGIQLAAAPFEEEGLLAAAGWCEEVVGFAAEPGRLAQ